MKQQPLLHFAIPAGFSAAAPAPILPSRPATAKAGGGADWNDNPPPSGPTQFPGDPLPPGSQLPCYPSGWPYNAAATNAFTPDRPAVAGKGG
ncbi:cytochrome c reductase iron-sulfur subunit [Apiospora arundinis]